MDSLTRVKIEGFRSIKSTDLELGALNVLIGANGAGKSNLLSFLDMLGWLATRGLQKYVGQRIGSADDLLFCGAKTTPTMKAELDIDRPDVGTNSYSVTLGHAAGDTLIFLDEQVWFRGIGFVGTPQVHSLGAGHRETQLASDGTSGAAKAVHYALQRFKAFHFHDTSDRARIRTAVGVEDDAYLRSDGGNLAAFLYRLYRDQEAVYSRIRDTVRQIAPFFQDFFFEPSGAGEDRIKLRWTSKHSDLVFGPQHLSDGTLRGIALIALLLQPRASLPWLIVIDEPELGLHPFAIGVLAALLKQVSHTAQVIVSTQSATVVDQFAPEEIIVVEQCDGESRFDRLKPAALAEWLQEYSLSELWQKNVLGGRPSPR